MRLQVLNLSVQFAPSLKHLYLLHFLSLSLLESVVHPRTTEGIADYIDISSDFDFHEA